MNPAAPVTSVRIVENPSVAQNCFHWRAVRANRQPAGRVPPTLVLCHSLIVGSWICVASGFLRTASPRAWGRAVGIGLGCPAPEAFAFSVVAEYSLSARRPGRNRPFHERLASLGRHRLPEASPGHASGFGPGHGETRIACKSRLTEQPLTPPAPRRAAAAWPL